MTSTSFARLLLPLALVGGVLWPSVVWTQGPQKYEITDLGVLDESIPEVLPTSINSAGRVVGSSFVQTGTSGETTAFLYSDGQMVPLALPAWSRSRATAINEGGQVAGWFSDGANTRAFVYANGAFQEFVFSNSDNDMALAINDNGDFVGSQDVAWGVEGRAFLYDSGVTTSIHEEIPGQPPHSAAAGLNAAGVVVGWSRESDKRTAFRRSVDGVIDPLIGNPGWETEAVAVNVKGQVAGTMTGVDFPDYGRTRAVLWEADGTFRDLGAFGTLGTRSPSSARALNAHGVVVGRAATGGGSCGPFGPCGPEFHAFVHRGDSMEDLNDLITEEGYELLEAMGINDRGQIVANGSGPLGYRRAFLLTPVLSPPEAIASLITSIEGFQLPKGIEHSFVVKLEHAIAALQAGNTGAACVELQAFVNHAAAQSGKKLTVAQANRIIAEAQAIRTALGCATREGGLFNEAR